MKSCSNKKNLSLYVSIPDSGLWEREYEYLQSNLFCVQIVRRKSPRGWRSRRRSRQRAWTSCRSCSTPERGGKAKAALTLPKVALPAEKKNQNIRGCGRRVMTGSENITPVQCSSKRGFTEGGIIVYSTVSFTAQSRAPSYLFRTTDFAFFSILSWCSLVSEKYFSASCKFGIL